MVAVKKVLAVFMAMVTFQILSACGDGTAATNPSGSAVNTTTSVAAGSGLYQLARQETVAQALWYSGDFKPFDVYYSELESMGYNLHDVSLKDNQWNVVYDYAPENYDSESVNAALKWTLPETINIVDGQVSFAVSIEGQGTYLVNEEPANPGIYSDANIFTAKTAKFRTTDVEYNPELTRQDFSDSILNYDMAGDDRQIKAETFTFEDAADNQTLIIVVYAAINKNYVQTFYYYDRKAG